MSNFIIRNDDVSVNTRFEEIVRFCEVCDRYGYKIIQSITPIGAGGKYARAHLGNDEIRLIDFRRFDENRRVYYYLKTRNDFIGVHGLWHTHKPTEDEVARAKSILVELGFSPTYFVPPFNEGDYPNEVAGLTLSQLSMEKGDGLESFLTQGQPTSPIMYLHSWRFNNRNFTFEQLDARLKRLCASSHRLWYNDWVSENATGKVLDVGKSLYWDYGFPTLDLNHKLEPTYVGNIVSTQFSDGEFDIVLCNGMYEFVSNPQKMIDEVLRITKSGGKAIFGFVGKAYKPYRKPWRYFEGKETIPVSARQDFGQEYHFLICQK